MSFVLSIIVLVISFSMFLVNRRLKLAILLMSSICLDFASFRSISFGTANQMICFFLFLSEFRYIKIYYKELKHTPIKWALGVITFSDMVMIVTSVHAHNAVTIIGIICGDLIVKYFVVAYGFILFKTGYFKSLWNTMFYSLLILSCIGVVNFVTKSNFHLSTGVDTANQIAAFDRFRAMALFKFPFDYGYICVMTLLMSIYASKHKFLKRKRLIACYVCSGIGIVVCGCRTVFVLAVIVLVLYYMMNYSFRKALMMIGGLLVVGFIAYSSVSAVREKVNQTLTAFTLEKSDESGSSSLLGRLIQYDTAITLIHDHKILGRGYRYFINDLGYNKTGNGMYDLPPDARPLLGLEGAIMHLILENGYFGVICYLLFYLILMTYCYELRKRNRLDASMACLCLISFFLYGNMTGELDSAVITFLLAGFFMKAAAVSPATIEIDKSKQKIEYYEKQYENLVGNSNTGVQGNLPPANT